jgi:hypothetical protein
MAGNFALGTLALPLALMLFRPTSETKQDASAPHPPPATGPPSNPS